MRRVFVSATLLLVARLGAADGGWTRTADAAIETGFVRRGVARAGAGVAPRFTLSDETWRFAAWARLPFGNTAGHEFGVSMGCVRTTESGLRLGLEATGFVFGNDPVGHPSSTAELTVSALFPAGPGRVEGAVTRDLKRRATIGELAYAGEHALQAWGAFLHYRIYLGTVAAADVLPGQPGARTRDAYDYYGADLTLPYRIGGETVVTAGAHGSGTSGARPFWSPSRAAPGGQVWFSLAVTREF